MGEIRRIIDLMEAKDEEEAIRKLHVIRQTLGLQAALKVSQVTDVTLRAWFRKWKLEVPKQGGHYLGKVDVQISEEEYQNSTYAQLAKKYGVCMKTIHRRIRKYKRKKKGS